MRSFPRTGQVPPDVTGWRLPVLMYHSVTGDGETGDRLAVPARRLEEQLGSLVSAGWRLVGLTEALAMMADDPTARVTALTFDDGLLDFRNAVEIMDRLGARATLYVPVAAIRSPSVHDAGATMLSWRQLGELASQGIEIGSHSCQHRPLDILDSRTLTAEVAGSRRELEDRLGIRVVSFSYPFGYRSARVGAAVERAGYRNACVVGRRIATSRDDMFTVPRLQVRAETTAVSVHQLVDRGETGAAPILKRMAAPGWRLVRRGAFVLLDQELT